MNEGWIGTVDISFFHDASLTQVCLGLRDLRFIFDKPHVTIMSESSFRTKIDGELVTHANEDGAVLRPFLNKTVTSARWEEMGTLVLTFEDANEVHLLDDSDQYESYTVSGGTCLIVI